MPMYEWTSEYIRSEDGRTICEVSGVGKQYRSRLVYCNYHNVTLDDISGYHVHHIDGNKNNDLPDNLELLTSSQHSKMHPDKAKGIRNDDIRASFSSIQKKLWKEGFYKNRKPKGRSYSDSTINEILKSTKNGEPQVSIARRLEIPRTSVQNIIYNGR